MSIIKTVFTVIDPTSDRQRALDRAIRIAKMNDAKMHAYLCIYSNLETDDREALRKVEVKRHEAWLETIVAPARSEGLDVTTQIDWHEDWFAAIAPAAKAVNSDLIVKPSRAHSASERLFMRSSDLALFKTAQCPVLLVKSEEANQSHKILMAIDACRTEKKYISIRDNILEYGKQIVAAYEDGELHAIHSYADQEEYIHIRDLERITGLDTKYVHVIGGEPEEAIAGLAKEINAQVIIIGLSTKSNLVNRVFGSTGEWLLNNLNYDLLVVFPRD